MSSEERKAEELLEEVGIDHPPVRVDQIASDLDIDIVYERLDTSVSGMLYRAPEQRPVIVVNDRHPRVRQRFTVAHELGHYRLHRGRKVIVDHLTRASVNMRDKTSSLASDAEEIAANRFAAALLMPGDWIHAQVDERGNRLPPSRIVRQLAELFDVSEEAMEFRLINLGVRAAP